jgi:RNA polymerase sigma-70 factor (ECF subfamily)
MSAAAIITAPASTASDSLAQHRSYLLRFARRRVADAALAEDLVHDVLVAAVVGQESFAQRSSLRTWLVGILKHKIADVLRGPRPAVSLDAMLEDGADTPASTALVGEADPCVCAEHRQRLAWVQARLEALPAPLRHAFEMHVLWGHSAQEVCAALNISPANLWVRVHRVRKQLAAA